MKLSTLLIGASALLTASIANTANATQASNATASNQTTYTVVCFSLTNPGEVLYETTTTDRASAYRGAQICNQYHGGIGVVYPLFG